MRKSSSASLSPVPTQVWGLGATLSFSALSFALFLMVGGGVSALSLLLTLPRTANPDQLLASRSTVIAIATLAAGLGGLAAIAGFILLLPGARWRDYLNFYPPSWRSLLIWNGLLIPLLLLQGQIAQRLSQTTDFLVEAYHQSHQTLPLLYLAVVGMAPLFEEVLFRGFMFKGIEQSRFGAPGAIALTSFCWAIVHVQYSTFFMAALFLLGLFLGYARHQTKSVWVPISIHAFNNLLAMIFTVGGA
ncbi:CPBP family intramembrane glutamic endopeptidase [Lyngbya confervoides]|uniref:CPBP family intramembrane metalloprotease n=1 Tax=Lyngbya confervoides BDU141951 TaxID=1574623 RepID=A0ABD4T843_9CYAN|nr:CPBP family intramembrane glutamic endopeptidase [Lyngbya confervoides]MCM1984962.1 CPBP family intramembrane metalloprotease [Lyngbya confervoides BDU141951]